MKEIVTEIVINAPRDVVWKLITDFNHWTDWNPSVRRMSGDNGIGSKLDITMCNKSGGDGPQYQPVITEMEEGKSFRWRAKMGMGFIFTNDKVIELEDTSGGTRLVHKELFSGLMLMMTRLRAASSAGVPLSSSASADDPNCRATKPRWPRARRDFLQSTRCAAPWRRRASIFVTSCPDNVSLATSSDGFSRFLP